MSKLLNGRAVNKTAHDEACREWCRMCGVTHQNTPPCYTGNPPEQPPEVPSCDSPELAAALWKRWHSGELARWDDVHALLRMVGELKVGMRGKQAVIRSLTEERYDLRAQLTKADAKVAELRGVEQRDHEELTELRQRGLELEAKLAEAELAKNEAYNERNKCVAVLATLAMSLGCPAWIGRHEGGEWEDDWRNIVFIELPTGQVSWHIHDSEVGHFTFLRGSGPAWDGHDTPEKYRRLLQWAKLYRGT